MTLVTLGLYTGVPHTAFRKMFLPTCRQLIELSKKSKIVENGLKISKLQACKVDQYLHRIITESISIEEFPFTLHLSFLLLFHQKLKF